MLEGTEAPRPAQPPGEQHRPDQGKIRSAITHIRNLFGEKPKTAEQLQQERLGKIKRFGNFLNGHESKHEARLREQLRTEGWAEALRTAPAEEKVALVNRAYQEVLRNPHASFVDDMPTTAQKLRDFYAEDPINGAVGTEPFRSYPGYVVKGGAEAKHPLDPLHRFMAEEARCIQVELDHAADARFNERMAKLESKYPIPPLETSADTPPTQPINPTGK